MAQYPPYACMADAAMATTNALKRVFPDCMRLVCYWHVQRKLRENMSALRAIDAGAADELASDINHLQVLSLDEESFKVLLKLLFKKWSSRSGSTTVSEAVQKFLLYLEKQWLGVDRVEKWYQAANPQASLFINLFSILHLFSVLKFATFFFCFYNNQPYLSNLHLFSSIISFD